MSLESKTIVAVGCGGSVDLLVDLARFGVRKFLLFDPDRVERENLTRQGYDLVWVSAPKVWAAQDRLWCVSTDAEIVTFEERFSLEALSGHAPDLILAATDNSDGQLEANRAALALRVPAVFPGVYPSGMGGEVCFWRPGLPCYRCLFPERVAGRPVIASRDVTLFDTNFIDAIAGQLALGLLGVERFARVIESLGARNFIRVKIDPRYEFNGRDVVRARLGVREDCEHFAGWCCAVESDPDRGYPPCPDCAAYGHRAFLESL